MGMDTLLSRITIDPTICHGKPCVRGLRYPVETLLELLSSGMTIDEILADYEDLEREDLLAVLAFAARLARTRRLQPVGAGISWWNHRCRGARRPGWLLANRMPKKKSKVCAYCGKMTTAWTKDHVAPDCMWLGP